jgi:endogenous inhibitor of DNA gyrase (YacG/DUF329 family)
MLRAHETPVCVFCRRHPVDPHWRPFCSERCKLQDLAAWAGGGYRVPGETTDAETIATGPDPDRDSLD